jgi:extradiol dioxygenase family protein
VDRGVSKTRFIKSACNWVSKKSCTKSVGGLSAGVKVATWGVQFVEELTSPTEVVKSNAVTVACVVSRVKWPVTVLLPLKAFARVPEKLNAIGSAWALPGAIRVKSPTPSSSAEMLTKDVQGFKICTVFI